MESGDTSILINEAENLRSSGVLNSELHIIDERRSCFWGKTSLGRLEELPAQIWMTSSLFVNHF